MSVPSPTADVDQVSFAGLLVFSVASVLAALVASLSAWATVDVWNSEAIEGLAVMSFWVTSGVVSVGAGIAAGVCMALARLLAPGRRRVAVSALNGVTLVISIGVLIVDAVLLGLAVIYWMG